MTPAKNYIRGFDGLRAFAVMLVLAAHSNAWSAWQGVPWFDRFVYPLVLGENGVLIFFTLSGFLITHLLLKEIEITGAINYWHFLARRALRLLPAFVVFWLALLGLSLTGFYDIPPASFAFAGLYLYNFIPKHFYSGYFGLTWSLGVEEQFYLIWPIFLRQILKVGNSDNIHIRPSTLPGQITFFTLGIILISLAYMALVPDHPLPELRVSTDVGTINLADYTVDRVFFPYRWTIPMVSYILLGCTAAAWADAKRELLAQAWWIPWLSALLFLAPWYANFLGYFPQKLLQTASFTLLILWIYYQQNSWLTKLLELRPLRHLGRLSYGLYLYSGIFLATGISHPEWWWQELPLALVLIYCVALVSHFTLEKWFLSRKGRFTPNSLSRIA